MKTDVVLPQWIDEMIFEQLGAKYCRSNADMTVIDWNKQDVLNYLGTYFPRSYAESYCIFSHYFKLHNTLYDVKDEISLFDFCCGTGGEIIGLLTALSEYLPQIKKIQIVALDGNHHALRLYETILTALKSHISIDIDNHSSPICIDDFYDLDILDRVINKRFDIIISFKAICEFVTKQQFEQHNAYEHIAKFLIPKLKDYGLMLLVDVSTYNNTSQEWLPKMMDKGLLMANCLIDMKNDGYNQAFTITHSRKMMDISKVAWRIIKK